MWAGTGRVGRLARVVQGVDLLLHPRVLVLLSGPLILLPELSCCSGQSDLFADVGALSVADAVVGQVAAADFDTGGVTDLPPVVVDALGGVRVAVLGEPHAVRVVVLAEAFAFFQPESEEIACFIEEGCRPVLVVFHSVFGGDVDHLVFQIDPV